MMEDAWRTEIAKEADRIREDTEYRYKAHYNQAAAWRWMNYLLGLPAAIFSFWAARLATTGSEADAGLFGAVAGALAVTLTLLGPNKKSDDFYHAGNDFKSLNSKARVFRRIKLSALDRDAATKALDELIELRDKTYMETPQSATWAYWLAKRGIGRGETRHEVDQETSA